MKKVILICCVVLWGWGDEFFSAQSPAFYYEGRVDLRDSSRVSYDWPGITIETTFSGSAVSVTFDDGGNWYNIAIDEEPLPLLKARVGTHTYLLADSLSEGVHSLKISKRFEQTLQVSSFLGITLNEREEIASPPITRNYNIEFIGASYVAAYGVESSTREGNPDEYGADDPYVYYTNSDRSYAHLVADTFNATPMLSAISGKGIVRNAGNDSPERPFMAYYDYTLLSPVNTGSPLVPWDFTKWQADVVVLNLGINDFSGNALPPADTTTWVSAYTDFIDTLQARYDSPPIIVSATGDWPHNLARANTLKVVAEQQEQGDKNVYYHEYSVASTALHWHPSVEEHREMAEGIIAVIREKDLFNTPSTVPKSAREELRHGTEQWYLVRHASGVTVEGVDAISWKLYSPAGRMISTGSSARVDLGGLARGVYHLRVNNYYVKSVRVP